jgi:pyruvate,orthophosphate dikinase
MEPAIDRDFTTLLQWTNQFRQMDVLASCDTADEVRDAVQFGADGIGLLRLEHL